VRRGQAQVVYQDSTSALEEDMISTEVIYLADFFPSTTEAMESWRYRYLKRLIDYLGAMILISILAIPGVVIALAILLSSKGPIFYREERIGRDGRRFRIWKFRSMYPDAARRTLIANSHSDTNVLEWRMKKHLRDPRITPIGGILRKWSLDELPQLINVIRGEMSLIGPRPIVQSETDFYGDLLSFYLAATPGLSGLWQVSGRSNIDYEKRAKLDATYVRTWNLRADLSILLRTIPAVIGRVGAL
jgi:exopolysaccharide production protein ExoY